MTMRMHLDPSKVRPAALEKINTFHVDTIREVERAIESHPIVVVGMAQNPFVKRARNALQRSNQPCEYLEYGSYFAGWKSRLAIKLWSGWPTFPQVFVRGELLGGAKELEAALEDGTLQSALSR